MHAFFSLVLILAPTSINVFVMGLMLDVRSCYIAIMLEVVCNCCRLKVRFIGMVMRYFAEYNIGPMLFMIYSLIPIILRLKIVINI